MGRGRHRSSLDQVGSLIVVLGGHMLMIAVLVTGRLSDQRKVTEDIPQPLIWIPVRPDPPPEEPKRATAAPQSRLQKLQVIHTEPPVGAAPTPALSPSPSPEPDTYGALDWSLEAEKVAKSMAPGMISELQRTCAQAERRAQALPEGCQKHIAAKTWEPEPKRAGFIGIFPYVRVGRCIIGLGFWGCAIGTQAPDGSLFEDMRNPDRPRSSVPDTLAPTFPQAPVPQVFKGAPELLQ